MLNSKVCLQKRFIYINFVDILINSLKIKIMKKLSLLAIATIFSFCFYSCKKEISKDNSIQERTTSCEKNKAFKLSDQFSYTFDRNDYSNEYFYERSGELLETFFKDVAKHKGELPFDLEPDQFVNFNFVFDPATQTIKIENVSYIKNLYDYMDAWERDEQKPQEYHIHCGGGTMDGETIDVEKISYSTVVGAVKFVVRCIDAGGTITISKLSDATPKPPIYSINMMIVFSDNYAEWETDNFDFKTFLFGDL